MSSHSKAIVTLVVGERYQSVWRRYFEPNWRAYADRHGYDLVVHETPLDQSAKAKTRSVAWQKCLILSDHRCDAYERVVWIDADIAINPVTAPCIASCVPADKIGGTDAYTLFTRALYDALYAEQLKAWAACGAKAIINRTGSEFYRRYGIETNLDDVIQTGVLVLTPARHREVLEHVYASYEDKGGTEWNYEMRPLSYEIVRAGLHHFVDQRFNLIYPDFKATFFPFLTDVRYERRMAARIRSRLDRWVAPHRVPMVELAATTAFANSFFLHFAAGSRDFRHIRPDVERISDFGRFGINHTSVAVW